ADLRQPIERGVRGPLASPTRLRKLLFDVSEGEPEMRELLARGGLRQCRKTMKMLFPPLPGPRLCLRARRELRHAGHRRDEIHVLRRRHDEKALAVRFRGADNDDASTHEESVARYL